MRSASTFFTVAALVLSASLSWSTGSAWANPKAKGKAAAAAAKKPGKAPSNINESLAPASTGSAPQAGAEGAPPPSRGPTRIDFDDRLIQGQTNKSGAVYLYERKELKVKSMIKTRDSFRDEIVGSLYDS